MSLLAELKEKYGLKVLEPYGSVVPIPASSFMKEWEPKLESEDCKVLSQSFNGQLFFFVKSSLIDKPDHPKRHWSSEKDSLLKELYHQELSLSEMADKLNCCRQTLKAHIHLLGLDQPQPEPEAQSQETQPQTQDENLNDDVVKEYFSACSLLFPSHRRVCAFVFRELSRMLEA